MDVCVCVTSLAESVKYLSGVCLFHLFSMVNVVMHTCTQSDSLGDITGYVRGQCKYQSLY